MVMLRCTVHVLTAGRSLRSADQVISDVSRFRLKGKEKKKKKKQTVEQSTTSYQVQIFTDI